MSGNEASPRLAAAAEVLIELGNEIEALGTALCQDPALAGKHMHELQAIDLIAQKQRALATLLSAGLSESALEAVGLDAVRARLAPSPGNGAAAGSHTQSL